MNDLTPPRHDGFDDALWQRLNAHVFDDSRSSLSLRDRLARDNGWTTRHADRVLEEYRRFVYLAVTAGHAVTPSEDVDQAWHLHLLYTRDYWERFCPEVLGQALHHGPTRGGAAEDDKFVDWYAKTLASYRHAFGREPPVAIWPTVRQRFAGSDLFRRVNVGTHVVLSRRGLRRALTTFASLGTALLAARIVLADESGDVSSENIALGLLGLLGVCAAVVGWIAFERRRTRKKPPRGPGRGRKETGVPGGCSSAGASTGTSRSGWSDKRGADSSSDGGGGDGGGGGGGGCGGGGGS